MLVNMGKHKPVATCVLQNEPIMCITDRGNRIFLKDGQFKPKLSIEFKTFDFEHGGREYQLETWDFRDA
jgi:hypothetical protein